MKFMNPVFVLGLSAFFGSAIAGVIPRGDRPDKNHHVEKHHGGKDHHHDDKPHYVDHHHHDYEHDRHDKDCNGKKYCRGHDEKHHHDHHDHDDKHHDHKDHHDNKHHHEHKPRAVTARSSNDDIDQYLSAHNSFRAQWGAAPLTWSSTLAAYAQKYANGCRWGHSQGPYGENLAAGNGGFSIAAAIKAWTDESVDYNPNNPQYSHFTQVVWKGSKQVGCAVASCNGISGIPGTSNYYVCEYDPPGNVIGEFAQNVGGSSSGSSNSSPGGSSSGPSNKSSGGSSGGSSGSSGSSSGDLTGDAFKDKFFNP